MEITIPPAGESITEVYIGTWHKSPGDYVEPDEVVVEIETDKATLDVPAPAGGVLSEVMKQTGESAEIGEVIAQLDETAEAPAREKRTKVSEQSDVADEEESDSASTESRVMPAAQRLLAEHGLEPSQVRATGPGGRLLKEDVQRHVKSGKRTSGNVTTTDGKQEAVGDREEEIVPMSPIRRRIAERLVQAQQQAALLTTFNEVDMSQIKAMRSQYREPFQKKYGVKLGFMSFFVKAVIESLKEIPQVNAEIRGADIVYRNYFDIGIAVGGGKGLVVPILRNAEQMSFAEIELTIADFAERAQANKLSLEELQGGTFTISNGGVYGSLLSTPIVNPPQSGVLGMHAIEDRPVVRSGEIVVRPMMYIALSYDHRLVDGREAVTFLKRIKETVEDPARILLEV